MFHFMVGERGGITGATNTPTGTPAADSCFNHFEARLPAMRLAAPRLRLNVTVQWM